MKLMKIRNSGLLILTAFIWGSAFVAQSEGGDLVGPYTFNSIRSFIGALVLLPVIFFLDKKKMSKKPEDKEEKKLLFLGGLACGIILGLASTLQQLGIYYGTSSGKAGFLTACYILIVPILGIFLKKKCGWNIWTGVVLALAGLYLLCMKDSFLPEFSDILLIVCALLFSFHILLVDYFSPKVDGVRLACLQFFMAGILCAVPMFFVDMRRGMAEWSSPFFTKAAWMPILYAGILSCGVGYTFQIIGQKGMNPTIASLLMSLESVFAVLAGWAILGESLSKREFLGCCLLFVAILLAQIPFGERKAGS